MRFDDFLNTFGAQAFVRNEYLLPYFDKEPQLRVQFSRWVKAKKIHKLRNGVYVFTKNYRKKELSALAASAVLIAPSYISVQTALQYYGMIPEAVFAVCAVTPRRANSFKNILGSFKYAHLQKRLFWGYQTIIIDGLNAYIAEPEKALLDYFYFLRKLITREYILEMRLQNTEIINKTKFLKYAKQFKNPQVLAAAELTIAIQKEK